MKGFARLGTAFAFGLTLMLFSGTAVTAHPDMQHGGNTGHLPAVQRGVDLIGKLDLFGNDEKPGRISDVGAFGNYAYLGVFAEPNCNETGIYVIDVSNPAAPVEVGFIPATDATFAGEGVQVLDMNIPDGFDGQVLIHSNETCLPGGNPAGEEDRLGGIGPGGASLWDVTDPLDPEPLAQHVGDEDADAATAGIPHNSHNTFGWQQGDKAYMLVMDNGETGATDIDIFDITDPANPELVLETGMDHWPKQDCNQEPGGSDENCPSVVQEDPPPNNNTPMIHDFVVKQVGDKWLLLASYWDAGYVIVDVTNIGDDSLDDEERAKFLGDTDFGLEPFRAEMGLPEDWVAEGNAHQAEFSRDGSLFLAADEDFDALRNLGTILSGQYEGDPFTGILGDETPNVPEAGIEGPAVWQGFGCTGMTTAPADPAWALTERGGCTFTVKVQMAQQFGYEGVLMFNDNISPTQPCPATVNPAAIGDIPFLSISRASGLKIMDASFEGDGCGTATPTEAAGSTQESVNVTPTADGWGYLHLYDAQAVSGAAASGTDSVKLQAIDHWALPESLDPTKAAGFGDLSIHEVAMDPDHNVAYSSHYAGGFRVFAFDRTNGIREVGAFIDQGGNNFWGVEVVQHPTAGKLVYASDRDAGLYIFGAAAPDLTLTSADISASSTRIVRGRPVTLTAVVHNIGQAEAENVVVKFREHRKLIGQHQTIESIPAGGTGTASVTWTPKTLGKRTITVVLDPKRQIAELRENNQRAKKTFTVRRR